MHAIICDIDGTLVNEDGTRNDAVYAYAKDEAVGGLLVLVTGRSADTQPATERELADLGIEYDELHCNDFGPTAVVAYKKAKAEKLLAEYEVDLAIDNDADARAAYADLGIQTLDPADITQTNEGRSAMSNNWVSDVRAIELRAVPAGDGNSFEGLACKYGVVDAYGTTFTDGCFTRGGLDTSGVYSLLWMHDPTRPVGTFQAQERGDGLYIVGRWDDNTAGREARAAAMSGSAADLSVGFTWLNDSTDLITEARLLEVSQVTSRFGAVPGSVLTAVRTAIAAEEARAGRVLSAANEEALRNAADLITGVLGQVADQQMSTDVDVEHRNVEQGTPEAQELETACTCPQAACEVCVEPNPMRSTQPGLVARARIV